MTQDVGAAAKVVESVIETRVEGEIMVSFYLKTAQRV